MNTIVGIVAGSGLDLRPLLDEVHTEIPFVRLGGGHTALAGHERAFVVGRIAGRDIVLQLGRFHVYEGASLDNVSRPVSWMADLGVSEIIFTNAVGALDERLSPGDLVAVDKLRAWPFARRAGPKIVEPTQVVSGCDAEGTYWWMHGPCYETRAEIAALRGFGGSVVGMSTLPELEHAMRLGLRTAVISCVTNGCGSGPVTHEEVLRVSATASGALRRVLHNHLVSHAEI